jgi:anti-anti-sigma factor
MNSSLTHFACSGQDASTNALLDASANTARQERSMNLTQKIVDGVTVLMIEGRIDCAAASLLEQELTGKVALHDHRVVIDLSQAAYISSAGFRVLLKGLQKSTAVRGRLVLCGIVGKVRQLFELGGFMDLFTMGATQEEGIAAISF